MKKIALFIPLLLGIAGLILEQQLEYLGGLRPLVSYIDIILVLYIASEASVSFARSRNKKQYLKSHIPSIIFLFVYLALFGSNRILGYLYEGTFFRGYFFMIIIRNILLFLKLIGRIRKFAGYVDSIFSKPAQSIVLSFFLVILTGTILLMMPVMTTGGSIRLVDAFFTATSAVCVTGLIVVDTYAYFTWAGKTVIMILIQIGGLGIMLFSYFVVFSLRKSVSLKDRTLLTYMLNESDMKGIKNSVRRIIGLTFAIEFAGALLLIPVFLSSGLALPRSLFYSLFHAVSAFCNAGFALFSDSLESFRGNGGLNFVIAALIICGGISFAVLTDLFGSLRSRLRGTAAKFSLNTKVVIQFTLLINIIALLVIYRLEHGNGLSALPVAEQYLSAFFQAVTLRTAGFNTLPFSTLAPGTLIFMIGIMFIGGASGSTAGGIKVNTLGVVWAYIQSFRKGSEETLISNHIVSSDAVLRAFTVIIFGVASVFTFTLILVVSEALPPLEILFESVSAFATVGLSTGITGQFSDFGKLCLIVLMFFGRIGPLTILSATAGKVKTKGISYPEATIMIG